jgi:hypothetical protein
MPVSLGTLERADVDEVLNMPHHNCNANELRRALQRMIEAGLMTISFRAEDRTVPRVDDLTRIADAGESTPDFLNKIFLELTLAGGAEWEKYAAPRWRLFVDQDSPREIGGEVHLIFRSVTRAMIRLLRDLVAYWGGIPVADQTIEKLSHWNALYWKDFPTGYELRINTHTEEGSPMGQLYSGGTSSAGGRLADVATYVTSLWDLGYRLRLTKRGQT